MGGGYRYAFSLSKEQVHNDTPPGTVVLIKHDLDRTATGTERTVDHLRLVPQPSDDPADPLNWPSWRKLSILWTSSFYSFVSNFTSASLGPILPVMAIALRRDFGQLTHLIAVNVLMAGAANLWWVPLANVYGRRPVLLFCTLLMTFSTMWCGLADDYNSLLAARVIQGIALGAADAVAPDVVGEVFFVHQRGRAMAVYTVSLVLGSLVAGVAGGYIAAAYGYKYVFWIGTALSAASVFFIFFLQPETLYNRSVPAVAIPTTCNQDSAVKEDGRALESEVSAYSSHVEEPSPTSYTPFTYGRSLRIGVNRGGLLRAFLRPWISLVFPGTWVVMLLYGGLVGCIVTMSTVGPTLVSMPPYFWGPNAGLINVGGIVGSILGAGYAYLTVDRRLRTSASHETDGHAEAESRLSLLFPPLFLATTGMWMFGFCGQYPGPGRWAGLEVGMGMLSFGLMSVPSIGFNYIIDAYNAISGDCFVMIVSFRAVISFAWTFFVGQWVTDRGAAEPFGILGMLLGIFSLLTFPLWLWGKRTRIATAKWLPARPDH